EGAQVALQTITGGSRIRRIPVAPLVPDNVRVARAEVRAKKGRVTAALEVVDQTTGHLTTSLVLTARNQDRDFTLPSAFHLTTLGNTRLRTDIRLFNPKASAHRVVATLASQPHTEDLAPRAWLEVGDVLNAFFGAEDGAQGRIQFQSTQPILVLAR